MPGGQRPHLLCEIRSVLYGEMGEVWRQVCQVRYGADYLQTNERMSGHCAWLNREEWKQGEGEKLGRNQKLHKSPNTGPISWTSGIHYNIVNFTKKLA